MSLSPKTLKKEFGYKIPDDKEIDSVAVNGSTESNPKKMVTFLRSQQNMPHRVNFTDGTHEEFNV